MKQRNTQQQLQRASASAVVMPADHPITPGGDSKVRRKVLKWMHHGASASPISCSTDQQKAAASQQNAAPAVAAAGVWAAAGHVADGTAPIAAPVPSGTAAVPRGPVPEPACHGGPSGGAKDPLKATRRKAAMLWKHCKQHPTTAFVFPAACNVC